MCGKALRKISKFASKGIGKTLRKIGAYSTGAALGGGSPSLMALAGAKLGPKIAKEDDKLHQKIIEKFPSDEDIAGQEKDRAAAEKAASDKAATDAQNAIINDENSRLIQKKKRRAQGGSSLLTGAQSNQSLLY